mmetsp:Transcript_15070/g.56802  ORF Transcript_15070/g.56802 Transcript_15070/m.56802 type:complete len:287 (+) Transcript_15070:2710-3570(+)
MLSSLRIALVASLRLSHAAVLRGSASSGATVGTSHLRRTPAASGRSRAVRYVPRQYPAGSGRSTRAPPSLRVTSVAATSAHWRLPTSTVRQDVPSGSPPAPACLTAISARSVCVSPEPGGSTTTSHLPATSPPVLRVHTTASRAEGTGSLGSTSGTPSRCMSTTTTDPQGRACSSTSKGSGPRGWGHTLVVCVACTRASGDLSGWHSSSSKSLSEGFGADVSTHSRSCLHTSGESVGCESLTPSSSLCSYSCTVTRLLSSATCAAATPRLRALAKEVTTSSRAGQT